MKVVAIDGPAGAGKSTIAKALAARLGLEYLDTGAMYRAVTLAAMQLGIDSGDGPALGGLARQIRLVIGENSVELDGVDVSSEIRRPDVTAAVSAVSAHSEVRSVLRALQRDWGVQRGGGVIEGRDIGSVVFTDATIKLFLTASPRVRAERRVAESGGDVAEIERAIATRDGKDSTRADSPLREPDGSFVVDTTGLGIDEVIAVIESLLDQVRSTGTR